jgi:hypothetical protein
MANWAVINNGVVVNCIVADNQQDAEEATNLTCVEYDTNDLVAINSLYDGVSFSYPIVEEEILNTTEQS